MKNEFSGRHPNSSLNPSTEAGAGSELEDTRRPSRLNGMRSQEQLPLNFKAGSPVAPLSAKGGERGRTNTQSDNYWSGTTNADNTDNAWNVNFNNGNVNNDNKDNGNNYVRPVRTGKYPGMRPLNSNVLFSLSNIYSAYLKCRRKKRNTVNALKFEMDQEEKLLSLQERLIDRTYKPGRSILFAATRPKLREIFAADFEDRIVHHILVGELEKFWEPRFIHDSYACRKQKGVHGAAMRAQKFIRQVSANGTRQAFYIKLDIRNFFNTLDKKVLSDIISPKVKDPELLWLFNTVLGHDCTKNYVLRDRAGLLRGVPAHKSLFTRVPEKGLPIGNLTSQFFANVYLDRLDQYVKRVLKCRHYIRYADDFVLFGRDKRQLLDLAQMIKVFLEEKLLLSLHPGKTSAVGTSNGLDFVGYILYHDHILIRRRVVNNLKKRLSWFGARLPWQEHGSPAALDRESELLPSLFDCLNSYLGHFSWGNHYRLAGSLVKKFKYLERYFELDLPALSLKRKHSVPQMAGALPCGTY